LAAVSPAVIETLYGPSYAGAALPLAVLSMYALIYSASFHSGDVYKAIGRPWILTATNAGKFVVMVAPIWWAASHSIVRVAVTLLTIELVHFVVRLWLVRTIAGTALRDLLKAVLRPLPAAACVGAVMYGVAHLAAPLTAPVVLIVAASAGLPAYIIAIRLTAPDLFRTAVAAIRSVRHRADPAPMTGVPSDVPSAAQHRAGSEPDSEGKSL
jgi:PST family polysaccharide transporter